MWRHCCKHRKGKWCHKVSGVVSGKAPAMDSLLAPSQRTSFSPPLWCYWWENNWTLTFAGETGKQIKNKVHQLQLVTFQAVSCDIPRISSQVVNDLSTDQRYLHEMCKAVSMGKVLEELGRRSPEHCNMLAGWLEQTEYCVYMLAR